MVDPVQVVSLLVAGVLGGIGLWWSRRKLRTSGVGLVQPEIIVNLRELADSWEDRFDAVTSELAAERLSHAATIAELREEQLAGARCRRELAGALSELHQIDEVGRVGRSGRASRSDR